VVEFVPEDLRFTTKRQISLPDHAAVAGAGDGPRWRPAPKAGWPASWPRSRCATGPIRWRRLPASPTTWWSSWPRRCSTASPTTCGISCCAAPSWRPSPARCARRWSHRRRQRAGARPCSSGCTRPAFPHAAG
jgi:hypothetical protein